MGRERDTEIGREHPLTEALADLRRRAGFERLSLSGLDQAGVVAFMEQAAGHTLDDEEALALAWAIHAETEGNPLSVNGLGVNQVFEVSGQRGGNHRRDRGPRCVGRRAGVRAA